MSIKQAGLKKIARFLLACYEMFGALALVASLPGGKVRANRTRTVTAILESAMNKEEGREKRLSERQFS